MKRFTSISIVVLALVLMIGIGSSHAIPTLTLYDGVNPLITIQDQGVGDFSPFTGWISYSVSTSVFQASGGLGISSGHTPWGTPSLPYFDHTSTLMSFTPGMHTMTLMFSDDDLGSPLNAKGFQSNFAITASDNVTGTLSTYLDDTNTLFGTGLLLGSTSFSGSSADSDSMAILLDPVPTGLFSLTSIMTITHDNSNSDHVDSNVSTKVVPTPEPGTLMLLGSGLAGIGFYRRRKK